jgi:hypothetical protein
MVPLLDARMVQFRGSACVGTPSRRRSRTVEKKGWRGRDLQLRTRVTRAAPGGRRRTRGRWAARRTSFSEAATTCWRKRARKDSQSARTAGASNEGGDLWEPRRRGGCAVNLAQQGKMGSRREEERSCDRRQGLTCKVTDCGLVCRFSKVFFTKRSRRTYRRTVALQFY